MAGQKSDVQLGQNSVLITDNPGIKLLGRLQRPKEILPHFLFDAARTPAACDQLAESFGVVF